MPITCICPQCQRTLAIGEEYAGQPMRCPLCMALFQSPPLSAAMLPAGVPGAAAPAPAPPPPSDPGVPRGPVWGGIGEGRARPASAPAPAPGYDWNGTVAAGKGRLEPGWHMVRRGLGLISLSVLLVTLVVTISEIYLLFMDTGPVADMIRLIAIPVTIIGTVLTVLGAAMCCLVPQPTMRKMALASAGSLLGFLVIGLLTLAITHLFRAKPAPTGPPSAVSLFVSLSFLPAALCLLAGVVLFLLFLRLVAQHFGFKRLGLSVLFCAGFIGISPLAWLMVSGLVTATAKAIQAHETGKNILLTLVTCGFVAVDLFWFLWVLRDVRRAVIRGFVSTAT
jgi:hypothetical protein